MPNPKVFCHTPWFELHVYWNGAYGVCCYASHNIHHDDAKYNVKHMSIREWYDSQPMKKARLAMHQNQPISFCSKCQKEESHAGTSRRHRCNQKSVIFTRSNFVDSYAQSPNHAKFEMSKDQDGAYDGMPRDIHIDLGNYCNLSCKMCMPSASSKIAAQYVRWGMTDAQQYLLTDWTRDQATWDRILDELSSISQLKNVHFMGGETLLTKRFGEFVDHMIMKQRHDLSFSFVTNGTVFDETLIDKLIQFQHINIEVSIETLTPHNAYQRQGTVTDQVLKNIEKYLVYCDHDKITLTARPAISVLTIGSYPTLLEYCLEKKIIVKSQLCHQPRYYDVAILPISIKQTYTKRYLDFLEAHQLGHEDVSGDYNQSDPNQIRRIIKGQVSQCLDILGTDTPKDSEQCLADMVAWCRKWDDVHGYDARDLYPEFREILDQHGY